MEQKVRVQLTQEEHEIITQLIEQAIKEALKCKYDGIVEFVGEIDEEIRVLINILRKLNRKVW